MKILLVEDDPFVAEDLKDKLEQLQYRITGIAESYEQAIELIEKERPGLVLLDIELKGELTGIDLGERLAKQGILFIYLTGLRDINTYLKAKSSQPHRYLSKPIDLYNLRNAIMDVDVSKTQATPFIHFISDKNGSKLQINPHEIVFIKADHNYCDVYFTDKSRSTQMMTMGEFLQKHSIPYIVRISRSYAINMEHIHRIRGNEVEMKFLGEQIRITDSYREQFNNYLKM